LPSAHTAAVVHAGSGVAFPQRGSPAARARRALCYRTAVRPRAGGRGAGTLQPRAARARKKLRIEEAPI